MPYLWLGVMILTMSLPVLMKNSISDIKIISCNDTNPNEYETWAVDWKKYTATQEVSIWVNKK